MFIRSFWFLSEPSLCLAQLTYSNLKDSSPMTWDPLNITLKNRKARRINKKAVSVYQNANKRVAIESIGHICAKKSMRLSNDINRSLRLSMRLDDEKGASHVSSRLYDGLPTDKQSFPNLKERLEKHRKRELNVDTDNLQFVKILKYGVRRDHNEWSHPRSLGAIKILNKKLNWSLSIPANFSSNLVGILPKHMNQCCLKDRLPDKRKYVIYNCNLNALIKAPFGVGTAFPNDPSPIFSSHCSLQEPIASSCNVSLCSETKLNSCTIGIVSTAIQTDP